ncbi:MAG: FadR/GntR family transcriptional regulator [Rubrobacteraceae bacterium]
MAKKALADRVVGRLIDDIAGGKFPPGSMLPSEAELAEREQVSRLTVREAITVLRTKKVLEVKHGRGTMVNPISRWSPFDPDLLAARSEDLVGASALPRKLIEARRLVEVGAAEMAADRRTEEDIEAMQVAHDGMKAADGDVESIVEADIAFHKAIMSSVGNTFITALFDPVSQLVREARRQTKEYPDIRTHAIAAHGRILQAIVDRDPEGARRAMREHLIQTELDLDEHFGKDEDHRRAQSLDQQEGENEQ